MTAVLFINGSYRAGRVTDQISEIMAEVLLSALCLNSCTKKQENEPVYAGCGFSAKGVSVQVSEKATLTPDTRHLQHGT